MLEGASESLETHTAFPFALRIILFLAMVAGPRTLHAEKPKTEQEIEVPAVRVLGEIPDEVEGGSPDSHRVTVEASSDTSWNHVVRRSPSIQVQVAGGESAAPVFLIRGHDPIQTRFFLEGIPLTGAQYQSSGLSALPLESIGAVEIHPEGTPVHLAEDGVGGAVNYRLRETTGASAASFRARVGSFGYLRAFSDLRVHSHVRAIVDVSRSDEDYLFLDNNGTPFNAGDDLLSERTNNGFERFTFIPRVRLLARRHHRLELVPLFSVSTTWVPGQVGTLSPGKLWEQHSLLGLRYEKGELGKAETSAVAFVRRDNDSISRTGAVALFIPSSSESWVVGGNLTTKVFSFLQLTSGAQWDRFVTETTDRKSLSPHERLRVPLGLDSSVTLGPLKVQPSVLAHWVEFKSETLSVAGTGPVPGGATQSQLWLFSPRLNLSWHLSERLRLRGSVGQFERAPALVERFGSPSGLVASPELESESAFRGSLGADFRFGKVSFLREFKAAFTVFYSRPTNLISLVQDSATTFRAVNIGASEILGEELSLEASSGNFGMRSSLAFLQTQNLSQASFENGRELPGRPPYRVNVDLTYESGRWRAGYGLQLNGPSFWDRTNSKKMAAWVEHQAYVAYQSSLGTFQIEGRNLGDSVSVPSRIGALEVLDNTTGSQGYPAPGRRFFLSWRYEV